MKVWIRLCVRLCRISLQIELWLYVFWEYAGVEVVSSGDAKEVLLRHD